MLFSSSPRPLRGGLTGGQAGVAANSHDLTEAMTGEERHWNPRQAVATQLFGVEPAWGETVRFLTGPLGRRTCRDCWGGARNSALDSPTSARMLGRAFSTPRVG